MTEWTIGFEYDDHQGGVYSAKSSWRTEENKYLLFDLGEQFNTFLKQIGFVRHNDYLLMEDLTEDEEIYLRGVLKKYRLWKGNII